MQTLLHDLFVELERNRARVESSLARLSEETIWRRPRPSMNSVGNLCLHLAGNESHYIGEVVGGVPSGRRRSEEFLAEGGATRDEHIAKLAAARAITHDVFAALGPEDLDRELESNHPPEPTVRRVILHVTEHYGYHTGQMVLLARLFQAGDGRILEWGH